MYLSVQVGVDFLGLYVLCTLLTYLPCNGPHLSVFVFISHNTGMAWHDVTSHFSAAHY